MEKRLARRGLGKGRDNDKDEKIVTTGLSDGIRECDEDEGDVPDRFKACESEVFEPEAPELIDPGDDSPGQDETRARLRSTIKAEFSQVGQEIWKSAPLGTLLK